MPTLSKPSQWGTRLEVKSATSDRLYIVSEKLDHGRPTGTWGCSCPGWKGYRGECKHLKSMGLKSCEPRRTPRPKGEGTGDNFGFTDAAYTHYDIRDGFGSAEEWMRQAEQHAQGRSRYRYASSEGWRRGHATSDMQLLGLTEMPPTVRGLVSAMRKVARQLHPDFGGDAEAFGKMIMAYERLLKMY
jgi:hypothetical protein